MLRVRPNALVRKYVIDVAIQAYWEKRLGRVLLNELCKRAKISKPGLYCGFGNEDGLKKGILIAYKKWYLIQFCIC